MSDKTKRVVGFTLGCFDLFHIGHINLLRNARALCDTLIVGVCSDEYMLNNKREPIYALNDRMEILKACKYCDVVVPEDTLEKWNFTTNISLIFCLSALTGMVMKDILSGKNS